MKGRTGICAPYVIYDSSPRFTRRTTFLTTGLKYTEGLTTGNFNRIYLRNPP